MRLQDVLLIDTRANQPAANTVPNGTLYSVSDESFLIEQSDGSAWAQYGPTPGGGGGGILPSTFNARVSGTTGVPVTTSDVTAITTLYLNPYGGYNISLFDGADWVDYLLSSPLSIAVPATTNTMYDLFLDYNGGTEQLAATAWTNDTTRATALTTQNGVLVKTGDTEQRYIGSFRTTGVSGQTEDSFARRLIWNYYNRKVRGLRVIDTTNNWNYTAALWQQANASAANQVDAVIGVSEDLLRIDVRGQWTTASGTYTSSFVGVGVGSVTASSAQRSIYSSGNSTDYGMAVAIYEAYPAVGYQYYAWLEYGPGSGTTTWRGDNGFTGNEVQTGMQGSVIG